MAHSSVPGWQDICWFGLALGRIVYASVSVSELGAHTMVGGKKERGRSVYQNMPQGHIFSNQPYPLLPSMSQ